ncbi:MAG: 5-formyltetrahydrofolate cyclo-ligase, partial [Oscillospiraceae bacterium]
SLKCGKKVAVPKCIDGTRLMDFYLINGIENLEAATFGVLEPITRQCVKAEKFDNSICIVPGLAFDLDGFRLGYGKGHYDRFLSTYDGKTIGISYCCCVTDRLPKGRYDKNVNLLITEKYVRSIIKEANNGQ